MQSQTDVISVQLSRFSTSHSRLIKDQQAFNCSPELELRVSITVEDEVSSLTNTLLWHQLIIHVQ